MATISAFDAKTRSGEMLGRVANRQEIVIPRHDRPVARIVPEGAARREHVRRAVAGLRRLQQQIRRRGGAAVRLSDRAVRAAIDKGRVTDA